LSHTKAVKESKGNNTSLPFLSFFPSIFLFFFFFFFCFFFRSINLSAQSCNNQNKRIAAHSHFKLILIFRDSDSKSRISKAIAEFSEGIFDHGQICWKEHELSFPDCTKTHQSTSNTRYMTVFFLCLIWEIVEGKDSGNVRGSGGFRGD
jgi:hypothetical protein